MIQLSYTAPPQLSRLQTRALIVGIVFSALLVAGAFVDRAQFFHAYLIGFIFWVGITVGSLALLMLQHLTGGAWGLVIRRVLESATRTLPLMVLLFVPIVIGAHWLYPWTHTDEMAKSAALLEKTEYLNLRFFVVR